MRTAALPLREAAAGGIRYLNMNSNSQLNAVRNFKFTIPPEFRNTDFKFIFRYQIPGSGEPEPGGSDLFRSAP